MQSPMESGFIMCPCCQGDDNDPSTSLRHARAPASSVRQGGQLLQTLTLGISTQERIHCVQGLEPCWVMNVLLLSVLVHFL